jgi:hypothetical protein
MHRALAVNDILYAIFNYYDPSAKTRPTLVCRQWAEISLDALWSDVRELRQLFRLLGRLRRMAGILVIILPTPMISNTG